MSYSDDSRSTLRQLSPLLREWSFPWRERSVRNRERLFGAVTAPFR
ncbi:MAG: hypothetical protein SFY80_11895 [Verrucomicrobiota bacterium]|nr:hypothetical protein [Verrucomicrobiota bacterium]